MIFKKKSLLAMAAMFAAGALFIGCGNGDEPSIDRPPVNEGTNLIAGDWVYEEGLPTGRWSASAWGTGSIEEVQASEAYGVTALNMRVEDNVGGGPTGGSNLRLDLRGDDGLLVDFSQGTRLTITYSTDFYLFMILEPVTPPANPQGWTRWHAVLPAGTHTATFDLTSMGGNFPEDAWSWTRPNQDGGNSFRLHSWGAAQDNVNLNDLTAILFQVPTDDDPTSPYNITTLTITQFRLH